MKRLTTIGALSALMFVLLAGDPLSAQGKTPIDGAFWIDLPGETEKLMYAAGLLQGAATFAPLLVERHPVAAFGGWDDLGILVGSTIYNHLQARRSDERARAIAVFAEGVDKAITGITAGLLRDGLDTFFADFRNRRIRVAEAAVVVVAEIRGVPKAEIERQVEVFRSLAVK